MRQILAKLAEYDELRTENLGSVTDLESNVQLKSLNQLYQSVRRAIFDEFKQLQKIEFEINDILILNKIKEEYQRVQQESVRRPSAAVKLNRQSELLRRIPKLKITAIQAKLDSLAPDKIEANIDDLLEAVRRPQAWEKNPAINHRDMPYYALLATQSSGITSFQFATLLLYWSATQLSPGKVSIQKLICDTPSSFSPAISTCISIFLHQGSLALEFLRSNFKLFRQQEAKPVLSAELIKQNLIGTGMHLTAAEYEKFIDIMKKMPASEQQFFVTPNLRTFTIVKVLRDYINFTVSGEISGNRRLIFSCGMMQAYLQAKFPSSIKLNPVLGISSTDDIRSHGLKGERDIGVPYPGDLLSDADGFSAPLDHFTQHDFYHAVLVSPIPPAERKFLIYTGDIVKNYFEEKFAHFSKQFSLRFSKNIMTTIYQYFDEEAMIGEKIFGQFIDLECPTYKPDVPAAIKKLDLATKYWIEVAGNFVSHRVKLTKVTQEEIFAGIFDLAEKHGRIQGPSSGFCHEIQARWPVKGEVKELKEIAALWRQVNIIKLLKDEMRATGNLRERLKSKIVPLFSIRNISSVFEYTSELPGRQVEFLQLQAMRFMAKNLTRLVEHDNFKTMRKTNRLKVDQFIKHLHKSRFFKAAFISAINPSINFYGNDSAFFLLTSPANVNTLDIFGLTALDYAIELNRTDIVLMLLEYRQANPNPQKDSKAMPSLFAAMRQANLDIFKLLLQSGFDLNTRFQDENIFQYYLKLIQDPQPVAGVKQKCRKFGKFFGDEFILYLNAVMADKYEQHQTYKSVTSGTEDPAAILATLAQ